MWLQSSNIKTIHGFSTRLGGVSQAAFKSLNLGGSDDDPLHIAENRKRALSELSLQPSQLCNLKQVHGAEVQVAKKGLQTGDALVSNQTGMVLAVSVADCYPLLFSDEENKVIGAAHAGWRGTCAGIASQVILRMQELGAKLGNIKVCIGPGISQAHFQVGAEVIEQFRKAGFSEAILNKDRIDLVQANKEVLLKAGLTPNQISSMDRCSFEDDFFSYRRDKGLTGRMWGLIAMP